MYKLDVVFFNQRILIQTQDFHIFKFLERDFQNNLSQKKNQDYSLVIEILFSKYDNYEHFDYYDENIYVLMNKVAIYVEAKFRSVWIEIDRESTGFVNKITCYLNPLYKETSFLSRQRERIYSLIYPNGLNRWQNTLIDLFHGIILGIIIKNSLYFNTPFLHASAAYIDGYYMIFPSQGQVGKSSLIDIIHTYKYGQVMAEDYCVLDENSVIGFQKTRAVSIKKNWIRNISYKVYYGKNRLNHFLHWVLPFSKSSKRRIFTWTELYGTEFGNLSTGSKKKIYFLKRGNIKIKTKEISVDEMADLCSTMMINELNSLFKFDLYLKSTKIIDNNFTVSKLRNQLYENYINIFNDSDNYLVSIPTFGNKDEYIKSIKDLLNAII